MLSIIVTTLIELINTKTIWLRVGRIIINSQVSDKLAIYGRMITAGHRMRSGIKKIKEKWNLLPILSISMLIPPKIF